MSEKRILVVGAGISGLCFLHACLQVNLKVKLIEKLPEFKEEGMGIALPANAMLGFEMLNLADKIRTVAYSVNHITYAKSSGEIITSASLEEAPLNKASFVSLRRAELLNILTEGKESHIEFGTEVSSLEERESDVLVVFNNGKSEIFDLLVIADGLHSKTRALAFSKAGIHSLGVSNWRFISSAPKKITQPIYYIGDDTAYMIYPLKNNKVYCYAQIVDKENKHLEVRSKTSLKKLFSHYAKEVCQTIDNLEEENLLSGRLESVLKPLYPQKNVVLIGDALHGCPPTLQQGVGMGIEDALVLARVLSSMPQESALKEFTTLRKERVDWVVHESNKIIRLAGIGKTFLGRFVRNTILRLGGPSNVKGWKRLLLEKVY